MTGVLSAAESLLAVATNRMEMKVRAVMRLFKIARSLSRPAKSKVGHCKTAGHCKSLLPNAATPDSPV